MRKLTWIVGLGLLACGVAGLVIWSLTPADGRRKANGKVLRSRMVSNTDSNVGKKFFPKRRKRLDETAVDVSEKAKKPDVALSSDDAEKLSAEMRKMFEDLQAALDDEKRQDVYKLVHKLQSMDEWPDGIPKSVKLKALDAIAWFGVSGAAEAIGFLADSDPEVVHATIEKFEEMLSDWSIGDRATATILKQVITVVRDADALDTFLCEMNNMRPSVRVDMANAVYGSGNEVAVKVLNENIDFYFGDSDVEVTGQKDLGAYLKANPDDPDADDFYGPVKD